MPSSNHPCTGRAVFEHLKRNVPIAQNKARLAASGFELTQFTPLSLGPNTPHAARNAALAPVEAIGRAAEARANKVRDNDWAAASAEAAEAGKIGMLMTAGMIRFSLH
jgi:hypothetical protein